MQPVERREQDFGGQPSYAAVFAPALLDPDRATPAAVAGPNGKAARKRYNVYRNNVTVSLINALAAVFPATHAHYRGGFLPRDGALPCARHAAHLAASVRIRPRLSRFHRTLRIRTGRCRGWRMWRGSSGPGSTPITPPTRSRWRRRPWLPSRRSGLADAVLTPHPATRIVRSRFPAVTIFAANRSDGPVGRIEATEPEDALVTRPGLEVVVRRLPPGGAVFLTRLIAGEPLGTAAAAALADSSGIRSLRQHRRNARGRRLHRGTSGRLMTMTARTANRQRRADGRESAGSLNE